MKKKRLRRIGRKVEPGHPRTKREARAHVDIVRCALEAAAIQLRQLGLPEVGRTLDFIAAKLKSLKKLARPT